jgi:hypothetical protein
MVIPLPPTEEPADVPASAVRLVAETAATYTVE